MQIPIRRRLRTFKHLFIFVLWTISCSLQQNSSWRAPRSFSKIERESLNFIFIFCSLTRVMPPAKRSFCLMVCFYSFCHATFIPDRFILLPVRVVHLWPDSFWNIAVLMFPLWIPRDCHLWTVLPSMGRRMLHGIFVQSFSRWSEEQGDPCSRSVCLEEIVACEWKLSPTLCLQWPRRTRPNCGGISFFACSPFFLVPLPSGTTSSTSAN